MADTTFPMFPNSSGGLAGASNRYTQAFPDPFFDYASTQMPRSLYDVLRWCFVPGTPVQMADGTLRAIEDVKIGELVLNRFGEATKVKMTSERPWSDMVVSITTSDGLSAPLESIPDHEHFVVRAPRLKPNRCISALKPDCIEKVKASEIRVGDYLISPQAQLKQGEKPAVDPYVAGTYLGDGWVIQRYEGVGGRANRKWQDTGEHHAARFAFAPDDYEAVARITAAGLKLIPTAAPAAGKAMVYTCHDYALTDDLKALCGSGAHTKQLSKQIYGWSREEALNFIAGYIDSDGHVIKRDNDDEVRGVCITSCNRKLLLQVRRLCNAAGMTPTLSGGEFDGGGGVVPKGRYERYHLFFNWYNMQPLLPHCEKLKRVKISTCNKGKTQSVVIKAGIVYRRVRSITEQPYTGPVYNLEIEGEHSYLVSGDCATSNCEYIWITNGTFRMASQRVVRYFLTKIELEDASDNEKEKYDEFLEKQIKIMDVLAAIGDDYLCYGNSITSVHIPFRRYLRCRKCKHERALDHIKYSFEGWTFRATCPNCGWTGEFERVDRRTVEQDKIRIIRWSPHEIRLLYHPLSHDVSYFWIPPADFKKEIRNGNEFYIATTPWEVIDAIRQDKWFKFKPGVIYHVKEETVAGIRNAGWGIPRILSNFKQAWYVQVLKRYNEAIGLDYIIPFRVVTPGKGSGTGEVDPLYHVNTGAFMGKVMDLIKKHRRDPTQWNALPFPVEYQALGGEGQDLAPVELINAATDEFLNAMGVPAEMYRGTLQVQAAPMALRLFERTWTHYISAMNGWINWFFETITDLLNWESISGRLQPTTLAEDVEKKQIQLQLAAAQQISKQTAYAPFGIDWREEVRRMFEEEEQFQEESKKFQKEQAKAQEFEQIFEQANAPPMPGQPAQPGAAVGPTAPGGPAGAAGGTTPEDLIMQAEQIAQQMLGMPYEARKSELLKIKKSDEVLHAMVIQKMDSIRNQAKNEGGAQVIQQMTGSQSG